jgi:FkbM family methyltransferase
MAAESDIDRVVQDKYLRDRQPGVLIEVGAAGPEHLSIGKSFRELRWRVISIEPNPVFCEAHRKAGNEVLQYACGDHDADGVPFTVVDSGGVEYLGAPVTYESFSSLGMRGEFVQLYRDLIEQKKVDPHQSSINVNVRRLDTILHEHMPTLRAIEVLAVDVEGWELEVMKGFSLESYRPRVVILENLFSDPAYHDHMKGRGYRLVDTLPPNEIYIPA